MNRLRSAVALEQLRSKIRSRRAPDQPCISICVGTGCLAYGCLDIVSAFKNEVEERGLQDAVDIRATGCPGFCERGALLTIYPQGIFYQRVKTEDVPEIVSKTVLGGKIIERLLYVDPNTGQRFVKESDVPFYKKQQRLLLSNNNRIDPTSIDDYLAIGGYAALSKALLDMSPDQIVDEVRRSGLRGRGGGGFPTGNKWESTKKARSNVKYVICNCDEGDPGAFMDRSLMEGNPHSVLEGMTIGAFAIGANSGYVYIRNEYPMAVENVTIAIRQAEEYGLLGSDILGSGFDFNVKVSRGGGAFICGESTALMASLEGRVGEPRPKHIHTALKGLYDRPTNLNNVETWANVPLIISRGSDRYSQIGTAGSKGTKIFSLVGKINNTGLVEVPMGITLREIIYDIGGGIPGGKRFKAIQTGGPSGGCLPESLIDLPVDFDRLTEAGSMMGSGGMIVMDEGTCMVDIARYFIKFLTEESCGKCVPCREGLDRMLDILSDITEGRGKEDDVALLEEMGGVIKEASLCALGGTAPNPVLSTIRYFRDEYEAHITERRCPAGVCKALITFHIDEEKCNGCMVCARECPEKAISGKKQKLHVIDQTKCVKCGLCRDSCKFDAVIVS